jgi:hypothetical protein
MLPSLDRGPCREIAIDGSRQRPALRQVEVGKRFSRGDMVEVLPWSDILHTLDDAGTAEGLPFMPEMLKFCGRRLTVTKRLERTCEEVQGEMRRIRDVVFLDDLRCDGSAHGGCDKACCFLWKDSWLRKPSDGAPDIQPKYAEHLEVYPFAYAFTDHRYTCQSTELIRATSYLSPFDLGSYLRDIRAKTYSAGELVRILSRALFLRLRCLASKRSYRFLEGTLTRTPRESLNLKPGEWIRVKATEEIARTLNKEGKNRGLAFTVEMLPFCGGRFRVLKRLEKMIHEPTRRLISVDGTVILENVTCDGCHILRGGCPKNNYHYWREVWLERV